MAANERVKGVQVHRPIIYGSHARLLTDEEKESVPHGHTHKWTVFLTSATSPPPAPRASSSTDPPPIDMDYIPGGADDLSYLIKKVTFKLHDTFTNPNRVCDHPPFQVSETGWGEFTVIIRLYFISESGEKPLTLSHPIKLHHWGTPVEGPPAPIPTTTDDQETPAQEAGEGDVDVKAEINTSQPDATVTPATAPSGETIDAIEAPANPSGDDDISLTPAPQNPDDSSIVVNVNQTQTVPSLITSKLPIDSWQYDELVFSDPLQQFLNIMNANPPTPLPPKNRRYRDQRDEYNSNKKIKGGRDSSVIPSRAGTVEPTPSGVVGTPGGTGSQTAVNTPGAGNIVVSKPAETASVDVPLEFSQEMEKGEWNRLNDVRIHLVDQMDKWREKLIGQEKELAKLKEEMR